MTASPLKEPFYLTGRPPAFQGPLARYLPSLAEGVAEDWLQENAPAGSPEARPWILDPFCASPALALAAARAGYRVLVAANNPVSRFVLEMLAAAPGEDRLKAALADFAAAYKGDERLEIHIRRLYDTNCAQCGRTVMASAFLWDRGASAPYARIYTCPFCGDAGERPVEPGDVHRAAQITAGNALHRARALERVAPLNDPDRVHAEEALTVYLPRAVYILLTLVSKLDSLPAGRRPLVTALLLAACDQANTLWPHPTVRARPRQLSVPPRFRENNIWLALEEAIELWKGPLGVAPEAQAPLTVWPALPPATGGICIFEGRLKEIAGSLHELPVQAVLAAIPRPNQAFWTLSALWAGWLWGPAAAAPFKSVLRRRRYDWAWHTSALQAAFSSLAPLIDPGTPCLGLIGEPEPGFLSAATTAAALSNLALAGLALREKGGSAQIHWTSQVPLSPPRKAGALVEACAAAGKAYLSRRAEPASFLALQAAALQAIAATLPAEIGTENPAEALGKVQATFAHAFTYTNGFLRFGGSEHSLEVGQWWLIEDRGAPPREEAPLADRVEMAVVRFLQKHPLCSQLELEKAVCQEFPGLLTPEQELIEACLKSYGQVSNLDEDVWQLNPQDDARQRRADLAGMGRVLAELGSRLGYRAQPAAQGGQPLTWTEPTGEPAFSFFILVSGVVGKVLLQAQKPGARPVLVYPGGRAGLIAFKLHNDPRLRRAVEQGWSLVKFRHLRRLAENPDLTRQLFTTQLDLDPLTSTAQQIPLL